MNITKLSYEYPVQIQFIFINPILRRSLFLCIIISNNPYYEFTPNFRNIVTPVNFSSLNHISNCAKVDALGFLTHLPYYDIKLS